MQANLLPPTPAQVCEQFALRIFQRMNERGFRDFALLRSMEAQATAMQTLVKRLVP